MSTMYGYENDGSGFVFAADGGVKTFASKSPHMRLYAPGGRLYNSTWGYYVIATTHYDYAELAQPADAVVRDERGRGDGGRADGHQGLGLESVTLNSVPVGNSQYGEETGANGQRHIWQCDGMATLTTVP